MAAIASTRADAEELRRQKEAEVRDEIIHGVRPSVPFEVAAEKFLNRRRERPLNPIDIARIKELTRKFKGRQLDKISETEWSEFVDQRNNNNAPSTGERYIDLVIAFLGWCQNRPRQWVESLPTFDRDQKARQRPQRRARQVGELRTELIALLIENAAPHLKGQMAIMWTTGARVSSLLYGCRLCDYLAAEDREQITFHDTKNGDRGTAAVHPWAAEVMHEYLAWRGGLEDREASLFLTDRRQPYCRQRQSLGRPDENRVQGGCCGGPDKCCAVACS